MAHPYNDVRQSKVERSRVGHITRGYASGGAVNASAAELARSAKALASGGAVAMTGKAPKARLDRPGRASGGRTNGKGATVNIIVGGGDKSPPPMAGLGMPPPMPPPPMPPPPSPGLPPGGPPMGMPPGPPPGIRSMGGRAYAKGGAVKSGPAWEEGRREGTQVSHTPGKNDLQELNRGKPITYAKGGRTKREDGGGVPRSDADRAFRRERVLSTVGDTPVSKTAKALGALATGKYRYFERSEKTGAALRAPITGDQEDQRARGGPVEAPKGNAGMGPKLGGGGLGGRGRLQKAARAKAKR